MRLNKKNGIRGWKLKVIYLTSLKNGGIYFLILKAPFLKKSTSLT